MWDGPITAPTTSFLLLQLLVVGTELVDIGPGTQGDGGWVPALMGLIAFFAAAAFVGAESRILAYAGGDGAGRESAERPPARDGRRRRSEGMREDPGLEVGGISACLDAHYDLRVASVTFLPIGYDPKAAVYEVVSRDGSAYFLKVRFGPVHEPGLLVPRALIDLGIRSLLAPLRTRSSNLWCPLDDYSGSCVVLYPFIRGESAMLAGLSDAQWREFGSTLRAVHASKLGGPLRGRLPVETFSLPAAALVRRLLTLVAETELQGPAAAKLAAFWREHAGQLHQTLARAEALGILLKSRPFEYVLCHSDIHAANILVGDDGRIHLIDWDGPLIAPRERDLLFVVGSKIARSVEPREEALFFEGYGPVEIDPDALVYYRYERIIEDVGEIGKGVFLDPSLGEKARAAETDLLMSFFASGGDIDRAETVPARRLPIAPADPP